MILYKVSKAMRSLLLSFLLLCSVVSTGFASSGDAPSGTSKDHVTAVPYTRDDIKTTNFYFDDTDRFIATVLDQDVFCYFDNFFLSSNYKNVLKSAFDMCLQLPQNAQNKQVIGKILNLKGFYSAMDIQCSSEYARHSAGYGVEIPQISLMHTMLAQRQNDLLSLCEIAHDEPGVSVIRDQVSSWPLDDLLNFHTNHTLSVYVKLMLLPPRKIAFNGIDGFFYNCMGDSDSFYFTSDEIAAWVDENPVQTPAELHIVKKEVQRLIYHSFPISLPAEDLVYCNLRALPTIVWPNELLSNRDLIISNNEAINEWPLLDYAGNITKLKQVFKDHNKQSIESFFKLLNNDFGISQHSQYHSYLCMVLSKSLRECVTCADQEGQQLIRDQLLAQFMFDSRAEGFMQIFLNDWYYRHEPWDKSFRVFLLGYAIEHGHVTSSTAKGIAEKFTQFLCCEIVNSFSRLIGSPYFFQQEISMLKKFLPGSRFLEFLDSLTAQDFSRNNFIEKFNQYCKVNNLAIELKMIFSFPERASPYKYFDSNVIEPQPSQKRFLLTVGQAFGQGTSSNDGRAFVNFCIGNQSAWGIDRTYGVLERIYDKGSKPLDDSMKAFVKAFLVREEVLNARDIEIGDEIGIDTRATEKLYKTLQARKLLYGKLCKASGVVLMDMPELTSPAQAKQKTLEDFMKHYTAHPTEGSAFIRFNNAMLRMASFTSKSIQEWTESSVDDKSDLEKIQPKIDAAIGVLVDRLRIAGQYQNLALIPVDLWQENKDNLMADDAIALKYKDLTLDKLDGTFLEAYPDAVKDLARADQAGEAVSSKSILYVKLKRLIQDVASSHRLPSEKFIAFLSIQDPALTELFSDALSVDAFTLEDSITIEFTSSVLSKMPSDSKLSQSLTAAGFYKLSSSIINKPEASGSGASDPAVDNLAKHPSTSFVAGVAGVSGLILSAVITHLLLQPELKKQRELRNQLVEAGKNTEHIDKKIARLEVRNKCLTAALGILGGAVVGTAGYMIAHND